MTKTKAPSKNTVFLQVFRGRPGFRGTQNAKNWEEIAFFGTSDWKFPIETPFFYLGAFPAGPPNFFCPTWFCDFCARSHQSRAFENDLSQKSVDDENEGTFKKHRFPAGFSCEAWVSGDAKRQKMGRNRLFRDLRLEISNQNAVFLSWGLPGRTSELFFPHLVLRFSRSGTFKLLCYMARGCPREVRPSPQMRGRLTRSVVDPAARCGTQAAHWP